MKPLVTRSGTLLFAALIASCASSHDVDEDPDAGDAGFVTARPDAGPDEHERVDAAAGQCLENQDCTLVPTGCCAACVPDSKQVVAVPSSHAAAAGANFCSLGVSCSPCPTPDPQVVYPQLRAACVSHQCVVVDTRSEDSTTCQVDEDCEVRAAGCCDPCSDMGDGWFAFKKGATDPHAPECSPIPPCVACTSGFPPTAKCAADKHCRIVHAPPIF